MRREAWEISDTLLRGVISKLCHRPSVALMYWTESEIPASIDRRCSLCLVLDDWSRRDSPASASLLRLCKTFFLGSCKTMQAQRSRISSTRMFTLKASFKGRSGPDVVRV